MRRRFDFRDGFAWRNHVIYLLGQSQSERWTASEEFREGYQAALMSLLNEADAARQYRNDSDHFKAIVEHFFPPEQSA